MSKILIVEDDRDIAGNIADFLRVADPSLECVVAHDGISGLAAAASDGAVALAIVDIGLPGMDGVSLCRRLRSSGWERPVIMLTARDTVADKVRGLESGADDYMVKPFSLAELLARVRAQLRRAGCGPAGDTLRVGDLELRRLTREVSRVGTPLRLGPMEYRMLVLFMERSPAVVLRSEVEALWDAPPTPEAVRSHIYLLRSIVDKPFGEKMLATVPNVGWTLRAPRGDAR